MSKIPENRQDSLAEFLAALFKLYIDLNFVYMEINPIVFVDGRVTPLDMAAKIDETASFLCGPKWGDIDFPAPFGMCALAKHCQVRLWVVWKIQVNCWDRPDPSLA